MSPNCQDARSLVKISLAAMAARVHEPDHVSGLSTGFHDFDDMTHGLEAGSQVTLASRPGMDMTTLSLQVASHMALARHCPELLLSENAGGPIGAVRLFFDPDVLRFDALSFHAARY